MLHNDEIREIAKTLKEHGVEYLKTAYIEIKMAGHPTYAVKQVEAPKTKPVDITPEEEKEIVHKVEEFKSVMQLDNEELINRLFPEPKEEVEDGV